MGPIHLMESQHVIWEAPTLHKYCAEDSSSSRTSDGREGAESRTSALDMSVAPRTPPPAPAAPSRGPPPKRTPRPIPPECKDDAYWERRKRNNESAKRSRELRRIKEQQTTLRVLYLEQENLQLRTELSMLRTEVDKLRQLLFASKRRS